METILELEGLVKVYRPGLFRHPVRALGGLNLAVRRGQIYGFVGPNGAGKTTTFKILLGLARATGGRGRFLGRPLGDRAARRRLGFLPELPAYYPHLTAGELLRFARDLSGVKQDAAGDARLLEELGLGGMSGRALRKLSKGQIQRMGLAQALVHEPELLILDEPMSGLDPLGRSLVRERLEREREQGRTVLFSSHVLADVEVLADTVGLVAEGELLAEGSPQELLSSSSSDIVIEGTGPLASDALSGIPGASFRKNQDDAWTLRLGDAAPFQVEACITRLIKGGGSLSRMETEREDLEGFFLRRMAERDQACSLRR